MKTLTEQKIKVRLLNAGVPERSIPKKLTDEFVIEVLLEEIDVLKEKLSSVSFHGEGLNEQFWE